jgi:hypothetical protein
MATFLDTYNSQKNKDSLRKESFFYFNDKYFKTPFNEYWLIEQQERFKAQKLRFFMPGRFYTYQYIPHGKDVLSFYDKRPIVYIIGQYTSSSTGWNIVQGVNINFLPEIAKVNFINTALTVFNKKYIEADAMSDADKIASMKEIGNLITDWNFMSINFNQRAKVGLQFAVRNYDITRIIRPVLIEIEDHALLPYYTPREFAGKSPSFIYQQYINERNEILKVKKSKTNVQRKFKTTG